MIAHVPLIKALTRGLKAPGPLRGAAEWPAAEDCVCSRKLPGVKRGICWKRASVFTVAHHHWCGKGSRIRTDLDIDDLPVSSASHNWTTIEYIPAFLIRLIAPSDIGQQIRTSLWNKTEPFHPHRQPLRKRHLLSEMIQMSKFHWPLVQRLKTWIMKLHHLSLKSPKYILPTHFVPKKNRKSSDAGIECGGELTPKYCIGIVFKMLP